MSLDFGLLADPDYVVGQYRKRQLLDAAAYGLGIARQDAGPTGEALEDSQRLSESLREYTRAAWPILEPGHRYVPNWHLDAISEHLEAVTRGDIRRLLINIPPRCMKSLSVSVFWMTWEWTSLPSTQWLFLTWHVDLCSRDSVRCRRLILHPWYQERWGHLYQLSPDQRTKVNFDNSRRGARIAKTMSGSRGQGGDRIVIDDPHNTEQAESEIQRNSVLRDWNEEISTRHNDPLTGATVVMMQRLHQLDLTGEILSTMEPGEWEHLMLPMRYDPTRRCVTVLGEPDPRTEQGEPLWPARFPPDSVEFRATERKLGPYGVAGQWQQSPTAREGGQFSRAWFRLDLEELPRGTQAIWVRHWDLAGTHKGGAYTCGLLMGLRLRDGVVFIRHVARGQWAAADRNAIILATAADDASISGFSKQSVLYRCEQEGGSGGKDQAESFKRLLRHAGYRSDAEPATGDKFIRADPFAGAAKAGEVYVLAGPWRETYLDEMEAAGPGAAYLDQMDASSAAYNWLMAQWDQLKQTGMVGVDLSHFENGLGQQSRWKGVGT